MARSRGRTARYYPIARTAHLERLHEFAPDVFFYTDCRSDFDIGRAPRETTVIKCSVLAVLRRVYQGRIGTLEVPEPMVMTQWPQLILVHIVVRAWRILGVRRVSLVSYCIENHPVEGKVARKLRVPETMALFIARKVVRFLLTSTERVCFGTDASRQTYQELVSAPLESMVEHTVVWAIPGAQNLVSDRGEDVVFLGSFEDRKGIKQLIEAWPKVVEHRRSARLTVMGMGGRIDDVRAFAARTSSVELMEDPPRTRIFKELDRAKVLVLFSQPTELWREQVGLPLVEGLSFGCEIVTSCQTGISAWLEQHGHRVLDDSASPTALAAAIVHALDSQRSKRQILANLPAVDGRIAADHYLFTADEP